MTKKTRYSFYRPHPRVQYTGELVNHKTGEVFIPPSRTKQQFVEECDLNNIVKRFTKTQLANLAAMAAKGTYSDLPDPIEFQDSMNLVIQAEQAFDSLPSKVRSRFSNDPAEFLAFMQDPDNVDEAIKMGLAIPKVVPLDSGKDGVPDPKTAPPGPNPDEPPKGGS